MQQTTVNERYTLRDSLGSGGMGEVFLAHDNVLNRDVALKTLHERYAKNKELVERFEREARSAAALNHPNVVPVYDCGKAEDGSYYTAMEYVPGGTLRDLILKEGALSPETATRVALQIAEALSAAHRAGIVHRDIKPQNILITASGDVKVTDFGIARVADASGTQTGTVPGTAHYVSPEQAMGEPPQPSSDLYSLGVVLYEMLTGELPYDADTPISVATKHVTEPPRPPREVNPEVPEELNAVVVRLLAKKPQERYADADALIEDLQRVRSNLFPTAAEETRENLVVAPILEGADGGDLPATARRAGLGGLRDGIRRHKVLSGVAALVAVLVLINVVGRIVSPGFGTQVFGQDGAVQSIAKEADVVFHKARQTLGMEAGVPDLAGMDPSGAKDALERAGLKLGEQEKAPSNTVPAGEIIEQDPQAGATVAPGTPVSITVSSGPEKGANSGAKAGNKNSSNSGLGDGHAKEASGGGKSSNESSGSKSGGSTSGDSGGVASKKDAHADAGARVPAQKAPASSGGSKAAPATAPAKAPATSAPSGSTPATGSGSASGTAAPASGFNGGSSYNSGGSGGSNSGYGSSGASGSGGSGSGSNGGSGYDSSSTGGGSSYGGSSGYSSGSGYGSGSNESSGYGGGSGSGYDGGPGSGAGGGSSYGNGGSGGGSGSGYNSGSNGSSGYGGGSSSGYDGGSSYGDGSSGGSGYGSGGSGYESGGGSGGSYGGGSSSGYGSN